MTGYQNDEYLITVDNQKTKSHKNIFEKSNKAAVPKLWIRIQQYVFVRAKMREQLNNFVKNKCFINYLFNNLFIECSLVKCYMKIIPKIIAEKLTFLLQLTYINIFFFKFAIFIKQIQK